MANKQRILLVDDHEVVRLGLKALLERHPNFEVVSEASTAREAVERVAAFSPDVVVMENRLPGVKHYSTQQLPRESSRRSERLLARKKHLLFLLSPNRNAMY